MESPTLPQSDHDLLVTIVATSKLDHAQVLDKISDIKNDLAQLIGQIATQHADHEIRLKSLESIALQSNWATALKTLASHETFISDYQSTHKERNARLGFYLSFASVLIALSAVMIQLFKR